MGEHMKRYKELNKFKQGEPDASTRIFKLATSVSLGFTTEEGRVIPKWPKAISWFCKMIQPDTDGTKYGCDPLQVEHALLEYCRKPQYILSCDDQWGMMTFIAESTNTKIKVDEVRWADFKINDKIQSKGALERLSNLIPGNLTKSEKDDG